MTRPRESGRSRLPAIRERARGVPPGGGGPLQEIHRRVVCSAHPRGIPGDGVQHRLKITGVAADGPEDVARRRLLLQRLGQVAVARLQLREQAHVLDGDHGLIGKRPEQLDLPVRRTGPHPSGHRDRAERDLSAHHRHEQECPEAADHAPASGRVQARPRLCSMSGRWMMRRSRIAVGAGRSALIGAGNIDRTDPPRALDVRGGERNHALHRGRTRRNCPPAHPHGIAGDDFEHRLSVGRRLADGSKDLARRRLLLEGLGQLGVPRLQLLEQAHVLDGDHRLVGKRLEQGHLGVREGAELGAQDSQGAEWLPLAQQRDLRDATDGVELEQLAASQGIRSPRRAGCRR